jgi:acetylornithine deacetylase/succinyl-diaminopimelate desuccinylase-like protein
MMQALLERMVNRCMEIQQIPAPTFHEKERAAYVFDRFQDEKNVSTEWDTAGNVLACLKGTAASSSPILVSAHLDTVFPNGTNLRLTRESDRIFGAGIGDNAMGVAGLFGLLWSLSTNGIRLKSDLFLIANVCEEGLGDLKGMRAVVKRFGGHPKAYIVLEGLALGHVYNRALGVRRYLIAIHTGGGHSWTDYGQPSAVHELANLTSKITALTMPTGSRTSLNVGKISGGTSVNTIAAEADMELDLRSENPMALEIIIQKVEQIVDSFKQPGVDVRLEEISQRPFGKMDANHPLVQTAQACLVEQNIRPILNIGSTDANLPISLGYPAVTIGLSHGGGAHTVHEYLYTEPLQRGLEQLVQLVTKISA